MKCKSCKEFFYPGAFLVYGFCKDCIFEIFRAGEMFKFFPDTPSAEKFANNKKCTERKIAMLQFQSGIIRKLINGIEDIELQYESKFERTKVNAACSAQMFLSTMNQFIRELIEEHEKRNK